MEEKFTKKDFEKVFRDYTAAWKKIRDFKNSNEKILFEWQELEQDWKAKEWAIKEILKELPKEPGLFAENEEIEIRIKKGEEVQIFPKEFYGKKI